MRTILLWALLMNNYRLFAPDFDDGSCLLIQPWVEWAIIPLLMVTLFMDGRAIIKRFRVLHPWRIKRQEYLRLRNWVLINSGEARGRV
ncbi:MAG: hypothetical protein HON68_08345 [Gammaproteobacteria bacterium]|nr:hypothetical protein [Gammaproteobacteria bacterium]MBT3489804.1 hypothetical protein [Gammaproteobacteria bacterium]MBT3719064.1 hypothetical protein [Gammaproteobacteria bacterium]MBT3843625.1 hypothetical protein [Gammaproteobacteria bacterium]MBT3893004.1 hypothetical protein [Gammaproteobacteria bacterium]